MLVFSHKVASACISNRELKVIKEKLGISVDNGEGISNRELKDVREGVYLPQLLLNFMHLK